MLDDCETSRPSAASDPEATASESATSAMGEAANLATTAAAASSTSPTPQTTEKDNKTTAVAVTAVPAQVAAAAAPRLGLGFSLSSGGLGTGDPAMQARMDSLLKEVDGLARKEAQPTGSESQQIEKLISQNREHAQKNAELNKAAAQREALIGQLQVQVAQAKMHAQQQAQQAATTAAMEREQLMASHSVQIQAQASHYQQQQSQLQAQLQQGLSAAAQSQQAQQVIISRLASFLSQTHHWLQQLSGRCAAQNVELPIEVTHSLQMLQSVSSVTSAFTQGGNTQPNGHELVDAAAALGQQGQPPPGHPQQRQKLNHNGDSAPGAAEMAAAQQAHAAAMHAAAMNGGDPYAAAAAHGPFPGYAAPASASPPSQPADVGGSAAAAAHAAAAAACRLHDSKGNGGANGTSSEQKASAAAAAEPAVPMERGSSGPQSALDVLAETANSPKVTRSPEVPISHPNHPANGNGKSALSGLTSGANNNNGRPFASASGGLDPNNSSYYTVQASDFGHSPDWNQPHPGGSSAAMPQVSGPYGPGAVPPTPNLTLSPSAFCSLLNSPDLHQLMSPQMVASAVRDGVANAGAQSGGGGGGAAAAVQQPQVHHPSSSASQLASQAMFNQFKRRPGQSSTLTSAKNMAV